MQISLKDSEKLNEVVQQNAVQPTNFVIFQECLGTNLIERNDLIHSLRKEQ
jgi:hypothetical protein